MKLHNLKNRKWNYVGLAFTFTFVGFPSVGFQFVTKLSSVPTCITDKEPYFVWFY